MTNLPPCLLLFGLAALGLLTACVSNDYRNEAEDRQGRIFALYRVEIDPQAVAGGARLLFSEPPAGQEFGHTRQAGGQFAIAENGLVSCRISVVETATDFRGRPAPMGLKLVDFHGRVTIDGESATIHDGDRGVAGTLGVIDELRLETDGGSERLIVQPMSIGKPHAYRFHFTRSRVMVTANVDVPWQVPAPRR